MAALYFPKRFVALLTSVQLVFCTYASRSHGHLCPTVILGQRLGTPLITAPVCPHRQSAQAGTAEWTATVTTWLTFRPSLFLCVEDLQTTERSQKVKFSHKRRVGSSERKLKKNCLCASLQSSFMRRSSLTSSLQKTLPSSTTPI